MKTKPINLTIFILLSSCLIAISQENEYRIVRGQMIDSTQKAIALVHIVSQKTWQGIVTAEDGTFNIKVLKSDTLRFSAIGYQTKIMLVSQFGDAQNYITLYPMVYMIGNVDIMDLRWRELKYTVMDMKLTPMEKNILIIDGLPNPFMELVQIKPNMVMNPVSAIYELLKKENIRKRKQARWNNTYEKTWIIKE